MCPFPRLVSLYDVLLQYVCVHTAALDILDFGMVAAAVCGRSCSVCEALFLLALDAYSGLVTRSLLKELLLPSSMFHLTFWPYRHVMLYAAEYAPFLILAMVVFSRRQNTCDCFLLEGSISAQSVASLVLQLHCLLSCSLLAMSNRAGISYDLKILKFRCQTFVI